MDLKYAKRLKKQKDKVKSIYKKTFNERIFFELNKRMPALKKARIDEKKTLSQKITTFIDIELEFVYIELLEGLREEENFTTVYRRKLDLYFESEELVDKIQLLLSGLEKDKEFLKNLFDSIMRKLSFIEREQHEELFDITCETSPENEIAQNVSSYFDSMIVDNGELKEKRLEEIKTLKTKATITNIEEFYFNARSKKRKITAYLGPTNSGKTHEALKKLNGSKTGVYLAPLRLLAREIYDDNKSKLNISLLTGEESIRHENETHISSTIEMLNIDREYDVAIIDEIQMINDEQRGNAWARAILGVNAKEVVVVGSLDSKNLLEKIAKKCKDDFEVIEFTRLSELEIKKEQKSIKQLEPGDAVICFSRREVYNLKQKIEKAGFSTAVVYGALPPDVRLKQAEAFNKGEVQILIATNAIGYGLNLSIRRILFSSTSKFNGQYMDIIPQSEFLQIAGRAGRFGKFNKGEVLYLNYGERWQEYGMQEYMNLAKVAHKPLNEIENGYYFPEIEHLEEFAQIKEFNNKIEKIIIDYKTYFSDLSNMFYMSDMEHILETAKSIDATYPYMDLKEKYRYIFAPIPKFGKGKIIFDDFIFAISMSKKLSIYNYYKEVDIKDLGKKSIKDLEELGNDINLFLWLTNRDDNYEYWVQKELIEIYRDIGSEINNKLEKQFLR